MKGRIILSLDALKEIMESPQNRDDSSDVDGISYNKSLPIGL